MASFALDVFRRLLSQVDEVEASAVRAEGEGLSSVAPILRRAGYVLAVAALDTFFHEHAVVVLVASGHVELSDAARVASYLKNVSAATVNGPSAESHVRLQLSYKTLVGPKAITAMMDAAGLDSGTVWHDVSFAMGSRPDRVQMQLQILYDRRNQIAHEGDWDFVQLDFRVMEQVHLADCVRFLVSLAEAMDAAL